jgi:hypothetical protein
VKSIIIHFDDKEFEQLKKSKKPKETWKEFIMRKWNYCQTEKNI